MSTKISWTDEVWNPVTGCTKVSAGCKNCYAEKVAERFWRNGVNGMNYRPFTEVRMHEDRLNIPLKWKKPRRVFVNSMSDLFHEDVPFEFIKDVYEAMGSAPQHTYQILTKRPERMLEFYEAVSSLWGGSYPPWVWLGVSCEDQGAADERIPLLLDTNAAVMFVSLEPLLGPIDLTALHSGSNWEQDALSGWYVTPEIGDPEPTQHGDGNVLDWVIVGGESGPNYRPMEIDWLVDIVEQCDKEKVPVFVKQDCGLRPGKQGRIPDEIWNRKEFPNE